jgi:hypothetical protein
MNSEPDMTKTAADHRRDHRQRALKAAKVVLSDWTNVDCTVRDLTKDGARLVFAAATSLPKEFRILVMSSGIIRPARLLWQRGLSAGITFTGPEEPAGSR